MPEVREHADGKTSLDFWRIPGRYDIDGILPNGHMFSVMKCSQADDRR